MTDEANHKFNVNDHVETITGANFRGRIIGLYEDFETGTPGAVVQATLEAYKGVKHVYPLAQLKLMFPAEYPTPTYVQHMGRMIRSTIKTHAIVTDYADLVKRNAITDADNREFVATVLKMLDTKEKWDALERIAKLQAKKPGTVNVTVKAPWSPDAKATEKLYADIKAGNTAEFETQRTLARTEGIETLVDELANEASKLGMYQRAKLVMANTKLAQSLDKMHAEYDKFVVKYDRMKAELAAARNEAGAFETAAQNYRAERDAMRRSINGQADALHKIKDALNPPSNTV